MFNNKLDSFLFGTKQNYRIAQFDQFDDNKYVKFKDGKLTCHDGELPLELPYFDPTGLTDEEIFARVDVMIPNDVKRGKNE